MAQKVNIQWPVDHNLCLGCGTCVSVCNNDAVKMVETPSGLLFAEVDHSKCNYCGLCTTACPGTHLENGLLPPKINPFKGNVVAAYCGQATDRQLLQEGQSGGVVTALLCHLLDSGQAYRAIVTQMPEDGSLRPRTVVTADREVLLKSQGSKYCPVAANAVTLKSQFGTNERSVFVGLPCHMHGLANSKLQMGSPELLRIGLLCEGTLIFGAIDHLISKAKTGCKKVDCFRYRSKRFSGWPGDGYVRTTDGSEYCVANRYRVSIKDTYTPARCRLCFDKMNILSDLTAGDAWGVREAKEGYSVVVARTPAGQRALSSAQDAGVLQLEPVDPELVFQGQGIDRKRRDWVCFMNAWKDMGGLPPDFGIDAQWVVEDKKAMLEPYVQKLAWARHLASRSSKSEVLKAANRRLRFQRWRRRLTPRWAIGFIWRRLKGLSQKLY